MADSTDTPTTSTETTATPVTAPVIAPVTPIAPITPVKLPVSTVTSGATTTSVPLSTSSPSTSTTAPTSSVAVTVPGVTGSVRFSLVVTDNLGVQSEAAYATVTIQGPPTAVLTATPATVAEDGTITLSGAGSTSSGTITNYTFSLAPAT